MWLRSPAVTRLSTLIASAFLLPSVVIPGHRLFDSKVLHWGSLPFDWVWKQGWPRGKRWFISLMTEVGYPILYHFNLILGVSSHLAPDANHKSLRVSVILLKVPELGSGHKPCFRAFMLKPLLQSFYATKRLYMEYGGSRGFCRCRLAWRVALEAPNWVFRSCLNGSLVGGGAKAGARAGEHEKYWRWGRKSHWYWLNFFEALWIALYWSEE